MSKFFNRRKEAFFVKLNEDVCYMKLTGLLDKYLDHVERDENPMTFEEFERINSITDESGDTA